MAELSHPYMTTGKTIALTRQTFVSKVISLLFNMPSRFVIGFFSRNKHFLISWLQLLSAVILEPKERKSVTASTFSSSICQEVMGPDVMLLVFLNVECYTNFSPSSFTFVKRLFISSSLSIIRMVSSEVDTSPGKLDSSL